MTFNIAIDGPAGAGKSTIAKNIARELSFIYVDTGSMYRAMAIYFMESGLDSGDRERIEAAANGADVRLVYENGVQQVILNGENVTPRLREEAVGAAASVTSAYPAVRAHLLNLQKHIAETENVVMDGRDIGTCVLPNADVKVYLTASSRVRAERRVKELEEKGQTCDFEEIKKGIEERDYRDMNREIAPLKQAEDAILIDSSDMDIREVTEKILELVHEKRC